MFGILIFELYVGHSPFYDEDDNYYVGYNKIREKILKE
jgi:hypothetical protein